MRLRLKQEILVLAALMLLVLLLRLPFMGQPFENDSSAIAYHARLIARGEPLYSSHHTGHHMPGAYYLYATAFKLLGDTVQSVKALLAVWTTVTLYLLYRLGTITANRFVGLAAAAMAAILYTHPLLTGTMSRIEAFIGLPQTAAMLMLLTLIKKKGRPWSFLWVGFFGAITFLFKVNYILSPLGLAGLAILLEFWRNRHWQLSSLQLLWTGIGFLLGLLPAILYFAVQGLLSRWLLIFTLGFSYAQVDSPTHLASPIYLLLYPLLLLARANPVILISCLAGVIVLFLRSIPPYRRPASADQSPIGYIALWFLFCFIETGVSRTYLNNYYLVFVPPLTLLAAWFWHKLYHDNAAFFSRQPRWTLPLILAVVLIPAILLGIRDNAGFYAHYYLRYLPGQESYDDVLMSGLPEGVGETVQAIAEIAGYLKSHSEPADTIYYWSNLMQLYYEADRRSAKEIIWPIYASATGPPEALFTATYLIIGGDTPLGYASLPGWLRTGLETHYQLETTLHGQAVYRRTLPGKQD